jgi:adenylate cyclase
VRIKPGSDPIVGLELENFKNEYLRSMLLIGLFAIGLATTFINYAFLDETVLNVYGGASMYFAVQAWLGLFIVYEVLVLLYLKAKLKYARAVSLRFKLVNTFIEVTYPTIFILYSMYHQKILFVIDSPLTLLYFLFIILSILHLDFKINILAGILAACQYIFITYYGYNILEATDNAALIIPENSHYVRGVIYVLCGGAAAFVSAELRNRIRLSFQNQQARSKLELLFGQQVSKEVSQALIDGEGDGRRKEATVMFVDVRNFTSFADAHPAEEVIEYQNKLMAPVIDVINQHQGVVFQILGDGLMACFGTPVENVLHADMAFQAGLGILNRLKELNASGEIPTTSVGIGLHSGTLVTGNIGSEQRKQFSVSGTPVIIASRIEQLNKKYGTQFLISESVYNTITPGRQTLTSLGDEIIRGLGTPVKIYKVETALPQYGYADLKNISATRNDIIEITNPNIKNV